MREGIAKTGGYEIITEGDSFSVAFTKGARRAGARLAGAVRCVRPWQPPAAGRARLSALRVWPQTEPHLLTTAVTSAAAFCLDVQYRLVETNWPSRVLRLKACRAVRSEPRARVGRAALAPAAARYTGACNPACQERNVIHH